MRLVSEPIRPLPQHVITEAVLLASVFVLIACRAQAPSDVPRAAPISYCGQKLTKPTVTTHGSQTLSIRDRPIAITPATDKLPARISSNSPRLANWSNLLVLSLKCSKGFTIVVASSHYVRTVGVAYDTRRTGIVALLLGRLKSAPPTLVSIVVRAYRARHLVGQVQLQL
jgi:hypothetical protein